jgi:hypothetical protein
MYSEGGKLYDSPYKKQQFDSKTLEPIAFTEPPIEHEPELPPTGATIIGKKDMAVEANTREKLMEISIHELRNKYTIPFNRNHKKEDVVNLILGKMGY